jgi:membrane fusion protein (multidrug efflux system)
MPTRNFFSELKWVLLGLLILLVTVGILGGIGYLKYVQIQRAMNTPPPPEAPAAVGIAKAEQVTFRRSTVVVGTVQAARSISLRTELSGMVTDVQMVSGEIVKNGQILVQLDVRTENAELKSAKAALKLASSEFERARKMSSSNAISPQELEAAAVNMTRMEAEVDRLTVLIDRKTLRAPFDARVGLFQLHRGQFLDAGTDITSLEGIADYVDVDFAVPQHIAESLNVGEPVTLTTGINKIGTANIIALDSRADALSRSLAARARFSNPADSLRPNDSVRVIVEYGPPITAVAIPTTAIRRGPTGTSVFLVAEEREQLRARHRNVVLIGSGTGSMSWVASGLAPGETVVAEGSFKLRDGALLVSVLPKDQASMAARTPEQESTDQ